MKSKYYACINCEQPTGKKVAHKSSFIIELALWIVFILFAIAGGWPFLFIPALFSLYRFFSAHRECEHCGSINLVPINTTKGKKIMEAYIKDNNL